ncbi:divalent cation transporter [Arcobacter sp. CECT 8983]|uniref:ZIP family metal transporter n=1 Tax=Arcobacter sp. CECT 8983 TaxID=2044508 RepID=UPI00100AAB40|nr:ZIP family metal transporter [Arcobacter sp. CECT 8983]RXJ89054.1 divalent cation transporter [Arcobacter sp. CECT 8983]
MPYKIIIFAFLAGSTVFIGGLLSYFFEKTVLNRKTKIEIIHFLTAFATGIMLAAVSFVLVPKGMHNLTVSFSIFIFLLGAIVFYFLDDYIHKNSASIPQFLSMLLDFIPESIALGAVFMYDYHTGVLLAIFIACQNLPEAFTSYIELRSSAFSIAKALTMLFFLSFIGVIFSLIGFYLLKDNTELTSSLMLFAAGGILYLIFEDIAPSMKLKNSRFIAFGVNLGFIVGMLGEALV